MSTCLLPGVLRTPRKLHLPGPTNNQAGVSGRSVQASNLSAFPDSFNSGENEGFPTDHKCGDHPTTTLIYAALCGGRCLLIRRGHDAGRLVQPRALRPRRSG